MPAKGNASGLVGSKTQCHAYSFLHHHKHTCAIPCNLFLLLFNAFRYTIGKERVFLEAAKTLDQKIYVAKTKLKVRT